jgi:fatty acid desaturase
MPFRRSLLTPDEIKELSQLSPLRPVVDVAWLWLQIIAAWWVVATWTHWWVVLLAIPVIGTRSYALHIIGHDGIHRRLLPDSKANDLFNDLFIFGAEGAITRINGQNHLDHHRMLATPDDPDRHKYASAGKATRLDLLLYVCGLSALLPLWRNVFRRERARVRPDKPAGYTPRDIIILVSCQSLLLVGLTLGIGWWAYPVLWLLPVYIFTFCGDLTRFFLEHAHPEPDATADERRLVTFLSSPLERVFFSPKNINLHAVHHLWPSIPYYNLARADAMIRYRAGAEGLIWRGSYLRALADYYRALPLNLDAAPEARA